jgi:hypothetical protein
VSHLCCIRFSGADTDLLAGDTDLEPTATQSPTTKINAPRRMTIADGCSATASYEADREEDDHSGDRLDAGECEGF